MVLYNPTIVATTDFIAASVSATTTGFLSIPANRYFSVDIQISGSQSGAGTATPTVTFNNTAAGSPATSGSVVAARLSITGLLGIVASDADSKTFSGYSGSSGATFDFSLGGGTASCTVSGFLL